MMWFEVLSLILVFFGDLTAAPVKQKVRNQISFSQSRGWPDSFWLRDLEVAVESCLKQNILLAKRQQKSPDLKVVKAEISAIFNQRIADLTSIEDQLEHTGFECLSEFETETRGLQDWLFFLLKTIREFEPKILRIVEQQHNLVQDSRFWLAKPERMLIDTRRCFTELFSNLTYAWSKELPDLICSQSNPNHAEIMETDGYKRVFNLADFFIKDLPTYKKELDSILTQDFRDNSKPEARNARKKFYNLAVRLSEQARFLEISNLCDMSDEEYCLFFSLIQQVADTIITRNRQLKYDQVEYGFFVKKSIWILMYWFYNIFPYKNFPWSDENFLVIENMFRQVSSLLDLGSPYAFKFNNISRYKFKSASKEKKDRVTSCVTTFN